MALALVAWSLVFARTVDADLNHDEHQFLAPAALLAREGLQPWRDYPLFHLPNLVFAYAAAERWTGDLILGAKLVGFLATAGLLGGLIWIGARRGTWPTWLFTLAVVLFFLADPLFLRTAGKTWNHEVPAALLIAAIGLLIVATRRDALWLTALAGVSAGLAAGCRLTFAPPLIGLFVLTLIVPLPWRRRWIHAATLTLSATLALAPSLYYLAAHPEAFVFGNLEFPRLRLLDPTNERIRKTMSWARKLRFFWKEIVLPSWPIFALWLAVGVRPGWQWLRDRAKGDAASGFFLLMFPFVLLGCFAPSRYQLQHFYVFIPLWLTAVVFRLRNLSLVTCRQRLIISIALPVAVVTAVRSAREYDAVCTLARPSEWFPAKARRVGEEMRAVANPGRILTLAPALALQGGWPIYPELATGAFAWRSAKFVPAERRARLHLIAPEDLESFLQREPPAGILTGVEEDHEEDDLVEWARRHGYEPKPLKKKRTLWIPRSTIR